MELFILALVVYVAVWVVLADNMNSLSDTTHSFLATVFVVLTILYVTWLFLPEGTEYIEVHTYEVVETNQRLGWYLDADGNRVFIDEKYNPDNVIVEVTIPKKLSLHNHTYKIITKPSN